MSFLGKFNLQKFNQPNDYPQNLKQVVDTLAIGLSETAMPININTACLLNHRHIYGKVEITYSDPYTDDYMEITSNGTMYGTDVNDTSDKIEGSTYPWFRIGYSDIGGSDYLTPGEEGTIGWWSTYMSDASGDFSTHPTLTVTFSQAQTVVALKVIGDDKKTNYPVNFTVKLYTSGDTLVHTETVTGNTDWDWRLTLADAHTGIVKIVLEISKINQANSPAMITEFYTAYYEEYEEDDLFLIRLLEEMEYESGTLPIGNISANEITVRLDNSDHRFSTGNSSSTLYNLLNKNRRIRAWFGVEVAGEINWQPLGVFWSQDWLAPDKEVWAEVTGYDRLEFIRNTKFSPYAVFTNQSIADLAEVVLQDAGLLTDEYSIDAALDSITIPYAWFEEMTHREALQKLAEAGMAVVYCDREGKVVMKPYSIPSSVRTVLTMDDIFDTDHPLAWSEIANYVEVIGTPLKASSQVEIYADTETFAVAAGAQVTKFYIYTHSPCTDVQQPTFTQSGADIHIETYSVYAWAVSVTFHNSGATSQNVTSVTVEGKKLESTGSIKRTAQDATSISANGKISFSLENEFIQSSTRAQTIADALLASYKDPRKDLTLDYWGCIGLLLGDRITAPDFRTAVSDDFVLVRQELTWDGGLRGTMTARRVPT